MTAALMNPFIYLLSDRDPGYLVDLPVLAVIILNFYLGQMRTPVLTFKNAMGLYWQDRWKPLAEAAINIVASLILVNQIGFIGVLIGTSISTISVVIVVEPRVIYKYGFLAPVRSYFKNYMQYILITALLCCMTYGLTNVLVSAEGWLGIFGRLAVCLVFPNAVLLAIYWRTDRFRYFLQVLRTVLHKRFHGVMSVKRRKIK